MGTIKKLKIARAKIQDALEVLDRMEQKRRLLEAEPPTVIAMRHFQSAQKKFK